MQTDNHGLAPSENLGVLRLRRRVLNQFSYMGGILTSRLGDDGSHNVVWGTDAVVRLFGQDYLTLDWAQSFDDGDASDVGLLDRTLMRLYWQRRGTDGLTYATNVTQSGAAFAPGMGFLRRRDYVFADALVGYGWRPGTASAFNRYGVSGAGEVFRRNQDDQVESAAYAVGGDLESRAGHRMGVNLTRRYEDLTAPFVLSAAAAVPVGSYWFNEGSISYTPPSGALVRPSANVSGGQFYDGTRVSFVVSPTWSVSRHLNVGGAYELNRIRFDDRNQEFTSHIGRLRTDLTFTTRTSASAFAQYNSAGDVVVVNVRFRYNPAEGTDLYIVWNESLNSDRFAFDPDKPFSQERTLMLKYARTFTLGL
jgi:hypothetical protein